MWRLSGCLLLAVCILVSACSGSPQKTYDAQEVKTAFRANGFKVEIVDPQSIHAYFKDQGGTVLGLLELFSGGELKSVRAVVSEQSGDVGMSAWVLDSEQRADSWWSGLRPPNKGVTRMQKRNVVVLVAKSDQRQAQAALDDLA